jgi:hypothetical protein
MAPKVAQPLPERTLGPVQSAHEARVHTDL